MRILLLIIIILIIALVIFIFNTIKVINKNNFEEIIIYFRKYLKIVFIILFLTHGAIIIVNFIGIFESSLMYIAFISSLIELYFFIKVFEQSKLLLSNLNNLIIFDKSNCTYTKNIGLAFVYLGLTEICVGLVIGIINLIKGSEFKLITNPIVTLYLAIGIILIIVSVIFDKAVELYKDNSLTI